jgi:hypothetical protein
MLPALPILRILPELPMLRMLPALPILRMLKTLHMLKMLPKLLMLPRENFERPSRPNSRRFIRRRLPCLMVRILLAFTNLAVIHSTLSSGASGNYPCLPGMG